MIIDCTHTCEPGTVCYACYERDCLPHREAQASEWIKCSERMPENGQPALLAFKPDWDETAYDAYGFNDTSDPEYVLDCFREGIVTHWMPLPIPPESE